MKELDVLHEQCRKPLGMNRQAIVDQDRKHSPVLTCSHCHGYLCAQDTISTVYFADCVSNIKLGGSKESHKTGKMILEAFEKMSV